MKWAVPLCSAGGPPGPPGCQCRPDPELERVDELQRGAVVLALQEASAGAARVPRRAGPHLVGRGAVAVG